jgi:capsule polysaccharide export protein KpsE/RkpR
MSIKPHSSIHDPSTRDDIIVVRRGENEAHAYELDSRQRHERNVVWLRLLWERRSFLFRIGVYGLVISALVAFLIPSRYTSAARLMPPDNQSGSGLAMMAATLTGGSAGSSPGGLGEIASDLLGVKSTSDLFVGILNSRTSEDALIQQFDLKKVYRDRRMEDARKDLADRTSVDVDRKSQIITISVTDRSPQRAAAMVQFYVEELDRLVAELSTSAARRERLFLEGRLQGVNQDLETAEKSFSQFASKNTAIDIPAQGKAMVDAAGTLQGQLIAAQSELEGLKQIYTDNNVRVRSITARVAELRAQLNKLVGNTDSTSGPPEQESESEYPSIRKLPLLGVTYADLYRQTKVQEAVYGTLTQEYELAKVQEAKEIPTVKVLDPANVPEKKTFPPRLLLIILGTALALAVGVTWVYAHAEWEATDPSDPRIIFAREIFDTVGARLTWMSRNGSDPLSIAAEIPSRRSEGQDETKGDK